MYLKDINLVNLLEFYFMGQDFAGYELTIITPLIFISQIYKFWINIDIKIFVIFS